MTTSSPRLVKSSDAESERLRALQQGRRAGHLEVVEALMAVTALSSTVDVVSLRHWLSEVRNPEWREPWDQ